MCFLMEATMTISRYRYGPKSTLRFFLALALFAALSSGVCQAQQAPGNIVRSPNSTEAWLTQEVAHQLLDVPWYSVCDDLEYQVSGTEVTLLGETSNPTLKTDAEKAVKL